MSIIIRLQNLPWSANSVDIRRFFSGLSIPEGGVHIVGGEMGDAFIAFSTDEDARLAMAKDGGKIKDMQIKLLLSSRTEMMRVIEQARQQNVVVTQAHGIAPQPTVLPQAGKIAAEQERRRGRSPSPRRRSRDRSPARDRRRSPDDRRSKRERSRSPRGGSRGFGRDPDRRGDRFKREEKRYDDSRYRDERRSARDSPQEPKKYFDADHVNSRSQLHATEGFRNMQGAYEHRPPGAATMYPFGDPPPKKFPEAYAAEPPSHPPGKAAEFSIAMDPKSTSYAHRTMPFRGPPFEAAVPPPKEGGPSGEAHKSKRRTRFEPELSVSSHFPTGEPETSADGPRDASYGAARIPSGSYPQARNSWPMNENSQGSAWSDERQALLEPPMSKNGDFVQVVPMDLEQSPCHTPEKEIYQEPAPSRAPPLPPPYARNNASPRRDVQSRGHHHADHEKGQAGRGDVRGLQMDAPQSRVPPSMTVEVRGLPPDATLSHILDLFRGISLPAANVRIEASDRGFEKAVIRFVSQADFEEALSRNRRFVHDGRCELVPCPADAFDDPPRAQKPRLKPKPREEDLTVQLRGLPFSCKEDDLVRFFDGLGILDLYVDVAPDGRASGTGFVEFGSHADFRAALAMNGKMIGHRYITISVASKEMMAFGRGEDFERHGAPRPSAGRPPHPSSRPPPSSVRPPVSNGRPLLGQARQPPTAHPARPPPCISMKGLPEGVTNRDIADILGQVGVMPRAVHIMLRPDKTPSGDAFVEFGSPADVERALELSGKLVHDSRLFVQPISFHEMSEVLGRPSPVPAPPAPPALLRTPGDAERARRPLLLPGDGSPFRERARMEAPSRAHRPAMEPFKGRMDRPFGPARMRGPRPYGIRPEGRFPPPSERGPKDFGAPGSVVSINNLHFRAGLEELLDFFRDYGVTKDNILRKFNENNQTTGEARVSFQSPRDAQRAVRELNRKSIMGRPLSLSLL